MAEVSLQEVSKRYGDVTAVDDLTLEARDKEFLVLVGPSGCGKTTTLRMVAGLDDVTSGTISIGDRVVNDLSPKDRDIAMVFQSYALYPHMNVFNNMAFSLKLRKMAKAEIQRQVTEAARTLDIEPLLKRKPRELSGGQRQRVALGRAIVRHPSVFLMDEPLSNLDAMLRVQTRRELISLHRRLETTVIYVTHDQTEAMTMGTRIAVMNAGHLQQADSPRVVYDLPVNTFVATFIGSPQMNMIEGELSTSEGGVTFQAAGLSLTLPTEMARAAQTAGATRVALGIRPEHISAVSGSQPNTVEATADVVEHMGSELNAYLQTGQGISLTARLDPEVEYQPGDRVRLVFEPNHLHLFDTATGLAIAHGGHAAGVA